MADTTFSDGVPSSGAVSPSSLILTMDLLREKVGYFLGYGRVYASMDSGQQDDVDDAIDSGLRRFYAEHDWRFLKPVTTLTCVSGTWQYDLPDDFGSMIGPMTFDPNYVSRPIDVVGESMIRVRRQTVDTGGIPQVAAVRWKSTDQSAAQIQELLLWPTPDAAYVLTYQYSVLPDGLLSGTRDYPYGASQHSQTILEACLAAAEAMPNEQIANHEALYQRALKASRDIDARGAAETLGCGRDGGRGETRVSYVYYDGVLYP